MTPLVSIVIISLNRKDYVLDCLASVRKLAYSKLETFYVDNGSTDGVVKAVRDSFPEVKVIECGKNIGLAGARNVGQRHATGEYILFLDSDVILDEDFLGQLLAAAQLDSRIAMMVPKMYYHDHPDYLWYAGATFNYVTAQTKNIGANQKDNGQYESISDTDVGPTAFLVKRNVANLLGGHDEVFFMSYADTDFTQRVKRAGFRAVYVPKAKLWHRIPMLENNQTIRGLGYTMPLRAYYFGRNKTIFMKKNASLPHFILFLVVFFPLYALYYSFKIIQLRGGRLYLKMHWRGTIDAIRYIIGLHDQPTVS
jgi:GT2 family glycosyltransferase